MKTAFLFPGQGAQQVGMGKDLYDAFAAARVVFDRAEELARLPLKRLCFEGPEEELARTDACQPAIFTVSAALLAALDNLLPPAKVEQMRPAYMAGLSLGEYSALYAADCLDFEDAVRLVTRRGQAMQAAAEAVPSGMVSVLGLDEAKVEELCRASAEGEELVCANYNCPGQIVLSGAIGACRRAALKAKDFGAGGAAPLKVAGAFHSRIMAPAAEALARAIAVVPFRRPRGLPLSDDRSVPARCSDGQHFAAVSTRVVSNVDARPYDDPSTAGDRLLAQLVSPVRWRQSMEYLLGEGAERFYEIGPGRVLAGLMRRIDRKVEVVSLNSREALEKLAAAMA